MGWGSLADWLIVASTFGIFLLEWARSRREKERDAPVVLLSHFTWTPWRPGEGPRGSLLISNPRPHPIRVDRVKLRRPRRAQLALALPHQDVRTGRVILISDELEPGRGIGYSVHVRGRPSWSSGKVSIAIEITELSWVERKRTIVVARRVRAMTAAKKDA